MRKDKLLKLTFLFISLLTISFARADLSMLLQSPQGNISSSTWSNALTSYLSQCADGDCPCVLVVAEGIQGQDTSANMWIGSFAQGQTSQIWAGYASRLANSGQNNESVSMDTNLCKRRNGVASIVNGQACIPGRSCKDPSVYRALADDLGLPDDVALTSFYFSTPMQNETYKFHDFYPCNSPPCPATLGCLGLERHAMKSLCLNYMGSDGSNGIEAPEKGGVWLYFHNINQPSQNTGSQQSAEQGLSKFENGLCSNVAMSDLNSGASVSGTSYSDGSNSDESSGGSGGSGGMDFGNMALQSGNIINENLAQSMEDSKELTEEHKAYQEEINKQKAFTIESCVKTTSEACPNADSNSVQSYCDAPSEVQRSGCKFGEEA